MESVVCQVVESSGNEKYHLQFSNLDVDEIINTSEEKKRCNYSDFISNNWLRYEFDGSHILSKLDKVGAALWIDPSGNIFYRNSLDVNANCMDAVKLKIVLCNKLCRSYVELFSSKGHAIQAKDLRMAEEKFTPFQNSEFYQIGPNTYRTGWSPTTFMQPQKVETHPETILKLIKHLVQNDDEKFKWVLNWLACFFQTLKKSQTALVFKGDQGSGKGILFNEIITPLFGEKFCGVVDDGRLDTKFKTWIYGKLFYNLNEISYSKNNRKAVKNFLKQLITDPKIQAEAKNKDSGEVKLFGNIIITANEPRVLEIEPHDRRYTVIQTGKSLKQSGWNIVEALSKVKVELASFAEYLRTYPSDFELYNVALDTPEKQAMVESTNDRFAFFISKLKGSNAIDYFHETKVDNLLQENVTEEYRESAEQLFLDNLHKCYEVGFSPENLLELFSVLNPEEQITTRMLMKKLRAYEPLLFQNCAKKIKDALPKRENYKSHGKYYFII